MNLLVASPLLVYLAVAAGCDMRTRGVPAWCTALALGGAAVMAHRPEGLGPATAAAGAALGFGVLLGPAVRGLVARSDVAVATVGGAWLGPGLALEGLALACAAALLAAVGMVAARSPRLLWQPPHAFGPLTAPVRAHLAIPCTLPLAAGFAATALLAARG